MALCLWHLAGWPCVELEELDFFGMSSSCPALGSGVQNTEGELWTCFLMDNFWERGLGKDLLVGFMALENLLSNKQQYLLLLKGNTKITVRLHMHRSHRAILPFLPSNSSCFHVFRWNRFTDYFYLTLPPGLLCGFCELLWLQWFSCLLLCHFKGLSGPCLSVCPFSPVSAPCLALSKACPLP